MRKGIIKAAHEYAVGSTNTRCSHMGECDGCSLRFCDYKSRREAFISGHNHALDSICNIPFDKIIDKLVHYLNDKR